jgi:PIN domain nuclease of toxin-antitoxin system
MRILLDTHLFLWSIKNDRRLPKEARSKILNAMEVYVSSASIWEICIKIKLGKLDIQGTLSDVVEAIAQSGFCELPITAMHAAAVSTLADIHRDPFDRILIAQAISEPLTLLTADFQLKGYSDLVYFVS